MRRALVPSSVLLYRMSVCEFQSLFLLNLPSYRDSSLWRTWQLCCFNPCFCGTCPRTFRAGEGDIAQGPAQFQSLFLWNLPSDCGVPLFFLSTNQFQSLFLWNLPSDLPSRRHNRHLLLSFNPCFCGTCPRTNSLAF